jgi:hypothetical protein
MEAGTRAFFTHTHAERSTHSQKGCQGGDGDGDGVGKKAGSIKFLGSVVGERGWGRLGMR